MHKQIPNSREYFLVLKDINKIRFTLIEWTTSAKRRYFNDTPEELIEKLKILFDYSIVGIPKTGGINRGTTSQFIYKNKFLEPNFGSFIVVHPALKKYLQLTESRNSQSDQTNDDDD